MKYKLELILPGLPKTTNSSRTHWRAKMAEARKWKLSVFVAVGRNIPLSPLTKAKVTMIRVSSKCPDFDGLVSSFKAVLDGLTMAKVLEDDNMSVIGRPEYHWEKGKMNSGHIKIVVEEI